MTDNSFFASLTPAAQKETNLLLGGGTVGSSDQHHAIIGMPSESQTNELFSGTNSGSSKGASSSDFGSSYDYHQNSPAAQAAIQKLRSLSSAGSQTTTGYVNAASPSDITANDKSALMNSSSTNAIKTTGIFLSRAALPTVSLYSGSYDEPGNGGSSSSGGDSGGGSASNPSLLPAGPTGAALADSMNRILYNSRDQIAHDYHGGSLTQAELNSCYDEMDHLITHKHWAGFDALHHVEVEISRWASTTQNYENMIQDVTGTAVTDTDKAWINWAEDTIAKSVGGTSPYTGNTRAYTYQDARYNLVHSDRVTSVINQAYQWELGRSSDASGLASQQNAMTDGQTITDIRRSMAFSAECTQDLRNEIVAVTGAQPVDTDNGWIQWVQNTMTDHPGYSLNYARSDLAHSDRATQIIRSEYQDCLGRDADSSGIQSYGNELANGATRGDIHYQLAHSPEACSKIDTIIQDEIGISAPNQTMIDSLQSRLSNNMTLQEIANNLPYMQPQQFDLSLPAPETNEDVVNNNATLKDYIANSPTATQEYNDLTAHGWKIKYINAGSETLYNRGSGGTIYINAAYKNVPSALMSQLAHEMGHALNKVKIDYSSQDNFVNSNLYGEGIATANNIKIYYELKNTSTEINVSGSPDNIDEYISDYNSGVKDNNLAEAYHDIGDYYGKHEVTGNHVSYYDYYADWYKSHR